MRTDTMHRVPRFTRLLALVLPLSSVACGSSDNEAAPTDDALNPDDPTVPDDPDTRNPDDPGAPPSGDPCGLSTDYPGDEFCLPPPDPSEGIQLHVGPTDYDDPVAVAPYLLAPGGEDVVCFNDLPEDGGFFYLQQENHMRSGSHHMVISLHDAAGLQEGPSAQCDVFGSLGDMQGSQTPTSRIGFNELAPGDEGLARWFPENAMVMFQLHYVNTSEEPVMREAWVNVYPKPAEEVTAQLNRIFLVGDVLVSVAPGERKITPISFAPAVTEPTRIYSLAGHSHAHNERFSVWRTQSGARTELLYESYDWAEPRALVYDSITANPAPDPEAFLDGGTSGLLHLAPGEGFSFECEVNNTTEATLNFGNKAYDAEMCLLGGSYVSDASGLFTKICGAGTCF